MNSERPILFNAPMVRALLYGSKTQTRRVVKPKPFAGGYHEGDVEFDGFRIPREGGPAPAKFSAEAVGGGAYMNEEIYCPYGQPGDRLWVRESYADIGCRLTYRADEDDGAHCKVKKWTPSIHMFRADSRILLEITSVRVERLQDINEGDAISEGCRQPATGPDWQITKRWAYRALWEQINGAGSWDANPWVWVIEFKRVTP